MSDDVPLFEVKDLEKHFSKDSSILDSLIGGKSSKIHAVDGVSFTLRQNNSIGVIGESGCGKTTLLKTLIGLQDGTGGEILYKGKQMSEFTKKDWKQFRRNVQIIFQDPFNSLDPKLTVGETLRESLKVHDMDNHDERVDNALSQVGLNPPQNFVDRFPRGLSGGEKQRVSIARAIILEPEIILADEPVSMLDVSTQADVLNLLSDLMENLGMSMIYISHDLSTVSYICDEIKVMYLGRIVESSQVKRLLEDPLHPYTKALINAIPIPNPHEKRQRITLSGAPSDPVDIGEGCRFRDRCPEKMPICDVTPDFVQADEQHHTACHLYYDHDQNQHNRHSNLDTDLTQGE
jgi:peptide/nickel transport system ATP-binding protein